MSYQTSGNILQTEVSSSNTIVNTSELLQYGGSAAAIILAVAVLLKAVAELINVLVPVMLHPRDRGD